MYIYCDPKDGDDMLRYVMLLKANYYMETYVTCIFFIGIVISDINVIEGI